MLSARGIIHEYRQTAKARDEFLDWARPMCTSCKSRPGGNRDYAGRCVDCRFDLLRRSGTGLCPTCHKIDAADAFPKSGHIVRQCWNCEQRVHETPTKHEAYLREVMNRDALRTATNARIARQRVGEIQHVISAQNEFPGFPAGSVSSNPDHNATPDCIVIADKGKVAVEVTELLATGAGHAHENALEIAQKSIWGAWQAREQLAGPRGRWVNISHWYFNDSLVRRIGETPIDEERERVQERVDEIAGSMFDGAGKVLDYLALRKNRSGVPSLELDSSWYDRWWGGRGGGTDRFLVLSLKQVQPEDVEPPERTSRNAYGGSITGIGRYESGPGFDMTLTVETIQAGINKKSAKVRQARNDNFTRWLLLMKGGDWHTAGRQNSGYKAGRHATGTHPERGARIDCGCFDSIYISTTDLHFIIHKRQDGTGELQEVRNGIELVPDH